MLKATNIALQSRRMEGMRNTDQRGELHGSFKYICICFYRDQALFLNYSNIIFYYFYFEVKTAWWSPLLPSLQLNCLLICFVLVVFHLLELSIFYHHRNLLFLLTVVMVYKLRWYLEQLSRYTGKMTNLS